MPSKCVFYHLSVVIFRLQTRPVYLFFVKFDNNLKLEIHIKPIIQLRFTCIEEGEQVSTKSEHTADCCLPEESWYWPPLQALNPTRQTPATRIRMIDHRNKETEPVIPTLMRKYNSPGQSVAPIIFSAMRPLENPFSLMPDFLIEVADCILLTSYSMICKDEVK